MPSLRLNMLRLLCRLNHRKACAPLGHPSTLMDEKPHILSIKRIWDYAEHNALCDLIRFQGRWFCTFRESDEHVYGKDGVVRILESDDGEQWQAAALIKEEGIDLRDPKLSITPQGKLMLLMGGSKFKEKKYISRRPRATFSDDGRNWGEIIPILQDRDWLWRATWHNGIAYGVSYCAIDEAHPKGEWQVKLFSSPDGINYTLAAALNVYGKPNETTLRFLNDGRMVALVRREHRRDDHAWIGISQYPYHDWQWKETKHHLGGPNFLILPDGKMIAAGRLVQWTPYGGFEKTGLLQMTFDDLVPMLVLPSGGIDTSYPGMVYHDGILWVAYYSSHEKNTAIYLARVKLN